MPLLIGKSWMRATTFLRDTLVAIARFAHIGGGYHEKVYLGTFIVLYCWYL